MQIRYKDILLRDYKESDIENDTTFEIETAEGDHIGTVTSCLLDENLKCRAKQPDETIGQDARIAVGIDSSYLSLREKLRYVPDSLWSLEDVSIRPIRDQDDLWFAAVECRLKPGQEDFVNPAGFSIGRAYLAPEKNVPCVICKADGQRIGFLILRQWIGTSAAYNWSYYLDCDCQGQGYGKKAARLAVQILKAADPQMPVKLSVEAANEKAQRLYQSIGFVKLDEMDGDDLVFGL